MDDSLSFSITSDGSKTLYNAEVGEHYHSRHGALQESKHVFIESGLRYYLNNGSRKVNILELGFGTGLNFLISAEYCFSNGIELEFIGIEAYPLSLDIVMNTGYDQYISPELWNTFIREYNATLQQSIKLNSRCTLGIASTKLLNFHTDKMFDIIYFDAFAAIHQPEMWTETSLAHICKFLRSGGVFVTYAITGNLKRTMKTLGFSIEKVVGAPGKREMLRAVKI